MTIRHITGMKRGQCVNTDPDTFEQMHKRFAELNHPAASVCVHVHCESIFID